MGDGRPRSLMEGAYSIGPKFFAGVWLAAPEGFKGLKGNERGFSRALEEALESEEMEPWRQHFSFYDGPTGRYSPEMCDMISACREAGLVDLSHVLENDGNYVFNLSGRGARILLRRPDERFPNAEAFRELGKRFYECLIGD